MTLTKTDLIKKVSLATDLYKEKVVSVIEVALDAIQQSLSEGDDVRLMGFGSFTVTETEERQGRHPRTNEPILIPASKRVLFRAGKELKEAVNGVVRIDE